MNRVVLMGNLGADAELKVLGNGSAVSKFSLATTEKWKDSEGNKQEKTSWHRCNLWGKRAQAVSQYLTKGTRVLVEGSIEYGSYEKDGVKHYTTDIKVLNLEFVGGGKNGNSNGNGGAAPAHDSGGDIGDDDLPF